MPMRDAMERASLGKRHANVLLAVAAAEPIGVSELAKRLGLLLSSTSTLVGELSRAGLLERAEDDQDRRRTIVRVHEDYRDAMEGWLEVSVCAGSKHPRATLTAGTCALHGGLADPARRGSPDSHPTRTRARTARRSSCAQASETRPPPGPRL